MGSNDYQFTTHWLVTSTVEEVSAILGDADDLVRWWPSVYLQVKVIEPGLANGLGRVVDLYTKGWLPYTLRWQFRVSEIRPASFALEAWGDFVGTGVWTFEQRGDQVEITYVWTIRADKPLLRSLSFLLKPVFSANHHWAMRMGETSLKLELQRRHAPTPEALAQIPPPPPPTPTSPFGLIAALARGKV